MQRDLEIIENYLTSLGEVLMKLPRRPLIELIAAMRTNQRENRHIFLFGNGGSAATAAHMVCDFVKNTRRSDRNSLKVISLCDNMPMLSAYANDEGYDQVFSQAITTLGEPGDLAIAISGSGNSPNVLKAVIAAREIGMKTAGLTGFQGGKLKDLVDICVVVPSDRMEMIEDLHMIIDHLLTNALKAD